MQGSLAPQLQLIGKSCYKRRAVLGDVSRARNRWEGTGIYTYEDLMVRVLEVREKRGRGTAGLRRSNVQHSKGNRSVPTLSWSEDVGVGWGHWCFEAGKAAGQAEQQTGDMSSMLMEEQLSAGGDREGFPLSVRCCVSVRNAAGAVPMGMGHPPTARGCCAAISFGRGFYRQA